MLCTLSIQCTYKTVIIIDCLSVAGVYTYSDGNIVSQASQQQFVEKPGTAELIIKHKT